MMEITYGNFLIKHAHWSLAYLTINVLILAVSVEFPKKGIVIANLSFRVVALPPLPLGEQLIMRDGLILHGDYFGGCLLLSFLWLWCRRIIFLWFFRNGLGRIGNI